MSEAWLDEYYAYVTCLGVDPTLAPGCGSVGMTHAQYMAQLSNPWRGWNCPNCGGDASFDDTKFEELHPE